jgi:hypothetical protein
MSLKLDELRKRLLQHSESDRAEPSPNAQNTLDAIAAPAAFGAGAAIASIKAPVTRSMAVLCPNSPW